MDWSPPPRRAYVLSDAELLAIYERMGGPAATIRIAALKKTMQRKRIALEAQELEELRAEGGNAP